MFFSEVIEKPKNDEKAKRKKVVLKDKAVQTSRGGKIKIEVEDLTSEGILLLKPFFLKVRTTILYM